MDVKSLDIFGSYVRGEARWSSDLDLMVEIDDPKMGPLRFMALENYLSDLLGAKVDPRGKQIPKPAIGRHVMEVAESIFSINDALESKKRKLHVIFIISTDPIICNYNLQKR